MRILVTAGPTREFWDDVRYLTNRSSGKMGYAIAQAAQSLGHRVTLISGPVALRPPQNIRFISVQSAREMQKAVLQEFPPCKVVIMAAAVCDFRPAVRKRGKLKKRDVDSRILPLVRNPDILRLLGRRKGNRKLIGFALEVQRGLFHAGKKLVEKNLDYIVLNDPRAFDGSKATVIVLGRDGSRRTWKNLSKREIGKRLIRLLG